MSALGTGVVVLLQNNMSASQADPFAVLPHMMSFSGPRTLCRAAQVARFWREAADVDVLWKAACERRWLDKELPRAMRKATTGTPGTPGTICLFPRMRMSSTALAGLSVKELKLLLKTMGIDSSRCVEKGEMRALVVKGRPDRLVAGQITWSFEHTSKWKASYVYSVIDSTRRSMSLAEVCDTAWLFVFKGDPRRQTYNTRFARDFTYEHDLDIGGMPGGAGRRTMRWHWCGHADHGGGVDGDFYGALQVESYPPLRASRQGCWGWILENEHVRFFSSTALQQNFYEARQRQQQQHQQQQQQQGAYHSS